MRTCTQIMVPEISWEGINGFEVTPEVKVTICAAASLITLGLPDPFFFDGVRSILVYPKLIKNRKMHRGLVVDESESWASGMAWQNGPLIFSWQHVLRGTRRSGDGSNVVVHEFAHHIDGMDGEMGGMPVIESDDLRQRWESVIPREYKRLVEMIETGCQPLIDPYAATNEAEFFAVTSEIFFDSPDRLQKKMPEVFDVLKAFYRVDPTEF